METMRPPVFVSVPTLRRAAEPPVDVFLNAVDVIAESQLKDLRPKK
jgi:hypothetical protein